MLLGATLRPKHQPSTHPLRITHPVGCRTSYPSRDDRVEASRECGNAAERRGFQLRLVGTSSVVIYLPQQRRLREGDGVTAGGAEQARGSKHNRASRSVCTTKTMVKKLFFSPGAAAGLRLFIHVHCRQATPALKRAHHSLRHPTLHSRVALRCNAHLFRVMWEARNGYEMSEPPLPLHLGRQVI